MVQVPAVGMFMLTRVTIRKTLAFLLKGKSHFLPSKLKLYSRLVRDPELTPVTVHATVPVTTSKHARNG